MLHGPLVIFSQCLQQRSAFPIEGPGAVVTRLRNILWSHVERLEEFYFAARDKSLWAVSLNVSDQYEITAHMGNAAGREMSDDGMLFICRACESPVLKCKHIFH